MEAKRLLTFQRGRQGDAAAAGRIDDPFLAMMASAASVAPDRSHFLSAAAVSAVAVFFVFMDAVAYRRLKGAFGELLLVQSANTTLTGATANGTLSASASAKGAWFDPFDPLTVKLLMMDHKNHYVYGPLACWLDNNVLHVSDRMPFVPADAVSVAHVAVAAMGARLLASDSSNRRLIGLALFEARFLLDSYDGVVSRARSNTRAIVQGAGGRGYYIDGVCDTVGVFFFFLAAWALLRRNLDGKIRQRCSLSEGNGATASSYETDWMTLLRSPDDHHSLRSSSSNDNIISRSKLNFLVTSTILLLALQQFLGSVLWNRYMQSFHRLLEVPHEGTDERMLDLQLVTIKSTSFWSLCWCWKLLNPHSHLSLLLCCVLLDRVAPAFLWLRCRGLAAVLAAAALTEAYLQFCVKAVQLFE